MRSSKSRSRNKSNRNRSMGNIVNRVFDSSGPEGKVRGTPQQIIEKYLQLARDAQLSNDRVAAENFQQHAEHYTRMLGEATREQEARREAQQDSHGGNPNANHQGGGGQNNQQNRQQQDRGTSSDPGSSPQPDTMQPSISDNDVIDMSEGNQESGLVETPEAGGDATPKPRTQRRPRRPKQQQEDDGGATPPSDQPKEATG